MNKGTYIETPNGNFLVRTRVGDTYFTYEKNENSFFDFSSQFVRNASNIWVAARLIER